MSNITISSGVTSTGPSAGPGDTITVLEGGTAISAQVSGYNSVSGTEIVFGSSVDAVVYAGGLEVISAGGSDSFSTISGGSQVDYGTTTGDTFLTGGGGTTYGVSFDVTVSGGATVVVQSGGVISGGLDEGGIFVQSDGSAVSTTIGSGGAISLDGGSATGLMVSGVEYNYSGSTTGTLVESGGIEYIYSGGVASGAVIGSDGAQYVYSGGSATGTVVSSGGSQYVAGGGAAADATVSSGGTEYVFSGGIVSGTTLETGGTIDLTNLAFVSSGLGSLDGSDNLTATEGASSQTISLAGNYSGESFQLSPDGSGGTDVMLTELCYLRGAHILTPTGETCIENLRIGDDVVTRFNGIQPIKWIGRQSYPGAFAKGNREKLPVCIRAGALGDRLPARNLYVSPGHSVLVGDNLIIASMLVNGVTITQDWAPPTIDYFQIELGAHDCVIAEGAWAETYADFEELREQFHNVAEFHALYPDYQTPEELSLCAPRPERGARLGEALRPVVARALTGVTPGPLHGAIDRIAFPWTIKGWAHDKAHPELPVTLEVVLDGAVIGAIVACDYRADLHAANLGQGRCSFAWRSPVRLPADAADRLTIRRAADRAPIPMTPDCKARIAGDMGETATERRGLRLVA